MLALFIASAFFTVTTVTAFQAARDAAFIQSHGMVAEGTVLRVENQTSSVFLQHGRATGGAVTTEVWVRARITVQLRQPVDGVTTTVADYPAKSSLAPGSEVKVLLDPRKPSTSELPGHPGQSKNGWLVLVPVALLLDAASMLLVSQLIFGWPRRTNLAS